MLKLKKEKLLVSLVVITLIALVFGSINSLAASIKPANETTNEASGEDNTVGAVNNTNSNTNAANRISSTVNSVENNTTNNTANNASSSRNTNRSESLPYAGTNSTIVFVVIALVASALYAYKKVSDYNV